MRTTRTTYENTIWQSPSFEPKSEARRGRQFLRWFLRHRKTKSRLVGELRHPASVAGRLAKQKRRGGGDETQAVAASVSLTGMGGRNETASHFQSRSTHRWLGRARARQRKRRKAGQRAAPAQLSPPPSPTVHFPCLGCPARRSVRIEEEEGVRSVGKRGEVACGRESARPMDEPAHGAHFESSFHTDSRRGTVARDVVRSAATGVTAARTA
ncbi:hypothetical protein HPB51_024798 [Rhipicephalus microplus]|uniref:Uncharacterized protein n=1 Tax=Rhipicephalus microplus TaxID=6941 RepID=A0A9J6EJ58_RHIMP|nr:hypothetical protein HPB51_024798 [Rhipicephalus microplus]